MDEGVDAPAIRAEGSGCTATGEPRRAGDARRLRRATVILGFLAVGTVAAAFVLLGPSRHPREPEVVLTIRPQPLFSSAVGNPLWHFDVVRSGAFEIEYRGPKAWVAFDLEVWEDGRLLRKPEWHPRTYPSAFRLNFHYSVRKDPPGAEGTTYRLKGLLEESSQSGGMWLGPNEIPLIDERFEKPVIQPPEGIEWLSGNFPGQLEASEEGEHVLWAWVIARDSQLPITSIATVAPRARWALLLKVRCGPGEGRTK